MYKSIFFSWQSDIKENRVIIESVLKEIIEDINKPHESKNSYVIEDVTRNEVGTINIENAIFRKIEKSCIYVADISIINYPLESNKNDIRMTPNPNVLIELGFAAGVLGWERIILIMHFREHKRLMNHIPFDIKTRNIIFHDFKEKDANLLRDKLKVSIQKIEENELKTLKILDYCKFKIENIFREIYEYLFYLFPEVRKAFRGGMSVIQFRRYIKDKTFSELKNEFAEQRILQFYIRRTTHDLSRSIELVLENQFITSNLLKTENAILADLLLTIIDFEDLKLNAFQNTKTKEEDDDEFMVVSYPNSNIKTLNIILNGNYLLYSRGVFKNNLFTDKELVDKVKVVNDSLDSIVNCIHIINRNYNEWSKLYK